MDASGANGGSAIVCGTSDAKVFPKPSAGRLTTGTVPNAASGPCCLGDSNGYSGVENQLYRVEIWGAGVGNAVATPAGATFKWSRENGSVQTAVTAITQGSSTLGTPTAVLTVTSVGRDQVLGFLPGNWIELTNEALQRNGLPGEMCQIDQVDASSRTITLTLPTAAPFAAGTPLVPQDCTRIIRWDQSGKVYLSDLATVWWDLDAPTSRGVIPVPAPGTTLVLESGVTVAFDLDTSATASGQFGSGDFWSFAARTATGQVDTLAKAPPLGPHHHYAKLGIVSFNPPSNPDCRTPWPHAGSGGCGCCAVTVGDGTNSVGEYTSINAALKTLQASGGEVRILAGQYFEDVVVKGMHDIVITGCGHQTRLASAAAKTGAVAAAGAGLSQLAAVLTVIDSQHIELRDFCVLAARDEVGVLLDTAAPPAAPTVSVKAPVAASLAESRARGNIDVAVLDLDMVASTLPAVAVFQVEVLRIEQCRVAMADIRSQWPAVYVAGREMGVERNWVGIVGTPGAIRWMPDFLVGDQSAAVKLARAEAATDTHAAPAAAARSLPGADVAMTQGGIQVAGGSVGVLVADNLVEDGRGNAITLGSARLIDVKGNGPRRPPGIVVTTIDPCDDHVTLEWPPSVGSDRDRFSVVAGPPLRDIRIMRNRLRGVGLCGIGPAGFGASEVVTVERLSIVGNFITSTMRATPRPTTKIVTDIGYGAIALPDVQGVHILDNVITDFGPTPGAALVCGIYVLHAEQAIIGRNQMQETRDWNHAYVQDASTGNPLRGGIVINIATPSSFAADPSKGAFNPTTFSGANRAQPVPVFKPTLPSLMVQGNLVRTALGPAFQVTGSGSFEITGNHFASGGTVGTPDAELALTVSIVNLALSLEQAELEQFSGVWETTAAGASKRGDGSDAASSDGNVLFTDNVCELETRANGRNGLVSVLIFTLDHVTVANNRCWVDGLPGGVDLDLFAFGVTTQVCGNRLQEVLGTGAVSGMTFGLLNVTTNNVSTACLLAKGPVHLIRAQNLDWATGKFCEALQEQYIRQG
nr:DUF6519 domain-containing protein [Variovorax sp. dw_954]